MSQAPGRPCPACGTNVPAGQRFCSNCGTDMEVSRPASQYGGPPPQNFPQAQPVPPYAQSPYGQQQQQYQQYQQQPQKSNPIAEGLAALGLLFFLRRYRPGYRARRQSSGCCGCLVALIILLAIFGTPAYLYYRANPHIIQQIQQNINKGSSGDKGNNGSGATSETVNLMFTYSSLDITITTVQYAQSFSDDSSVSSGGVRVAFKETASQPIGGFLYGDVARLILADQSIVAPTNTQYSISPDTGTSRTNWIDFPVTTQPADLSKLVFQMGSAQQNQMQIPLSSGADLSKYQPKTANPNKPISYGGLNWMLKKATSSLSIAGKQATTGMRYVVLTFNVDNPTSTVVYAEFASDYMRLKSGDVTSSPTDTTLPSIPANSSGLSGTVTFLMPNNGNAFTLILLALQAGIHPSSPTQVNTDFKI